MKAAILGHDRAEPVGLFDELLEARGMPSETVRLDETNDLPRWTGDAALVLMGGPMSVNDGSAYPGLCEEKALIRDAVADGRPVLGVCLGAQLIASALGARVYPSIREIGWTALMGLPGNPLFPGTFTVFDLHGETYDLPAGARLFATGEAVPHQAFAVGSAPGLQFHLEATPSMIAAWNEDLPEAQRARNARETDRNIPSARGLCERVVDHVLRP